MGVIFMIAAAALLIDQLTKMLVVGFFLDPMQPLIEGFLHTEGQTHPVIDKVFSFTYVLNDGAAFGILQNQRLFFLIMTFLACAAGIILLLRMPRKHWLLKVSSGLILGGALGNLVDRVIVGSVRDFLDATFIETLTGYSFPVFNGADVFVVVGVLMLAVYILFVHDKVYEPKKKDEQD